MRIADSHAVITGGSSGIGLATALELGRRGARVSLLARRSGPLDRAVDALRRAGIEAGHRAVDVTDRAAVADAIDAVAGARGPCDLLVTSAGRSRPGRFLALADADFEHLVAVNYFGTLWPVRVVAADLARRGTGSIVGVSSDAGIVGIYGYSAYGASKFAVRGLFEVLRAELGPLGVHVGLCCPPDVDTPMLAEEEHLKPPETQAIGAGIAPLSPERVARSIAEGIERERFWIMAERQSALLRVAAGPAWGALNRVQDRIARRAAAMAREAGNADSV
ncbi:MAG: SDR family NAD(P)-dependent oxidoreductase [Acidimicrobiales bacterium]|nr:SDR family NAD(P)-dependent oxidoreductase [Acidimicrobiales bacterium]